MLISLLINICAKPYSSIFIKKTSMGFKTKIDASNNRQFAQRERSETLFPGVTRFGLAQDDLSKGPDLNTIRVLIPSVDNVTSTFTGDTSTGVYNWSFGFPDMAWAEDEIINFDLNSQEGDIQEIGIVWEGKDPVEVNGETVYTRYEGVRFDLTLAEINDDGNNQVSGSTRSTFEKLEADALDYTGDFIWVDVRGNIQTDNIMIKKIGIGASVVDLGADADGKIVNVASDERLKENIKPLQSALEKVLGLQGVTYNWKDRKAGTDAVRIGFVAQQVKEVVPELVYTLPDSDQMSVYYNNAVPLIVEAIKELVAGGFKPATEEDVETVTKTKELNFEVIYAEDNSIELNYNGTHETALKGGVIVKNGIAEGQDSSLMIDQNGDWDVFPNMKIRKYTPTSTQDPSGNEGNITRDEDYLYIKTPQGWKRTGLERF
jgi:hypothetical protein